LGGAAVTVRILQGDCRAVLDTLGPESFDACIADPPYEDTSLAWDKACAGWIPAVSRVLKESASIWVFGSMRHLVVDRVFAKMRREGFRYSQDIVWQKQNGTGFHNDRFRRVHEHAVLFYRGPWERVHHAPQFTLDATAKTVRRKTRPTHTGYIEAGHYVSEDGGPRLERTVQNIRNEHGRAIHPTQKPVALLQKLIRYSSPPGGSVVDPFGGSGSTAMAARNVGRTCTCVEVDAAMVEKSREWLAGGALFAEVAA
jgi:site-specific DNA-methyltransferase (adenine-specific)